MSSAGAMAVQDPAQHREPGRLARVRLGSTDLVVSRLGLGTVELGLAYGIDEAPPPPATAAIRAVHRALDHGIDYFDTAAGYGASEELLGRALAGRSQRPVVATKVSLPRSPDGARLAPEPLRRWVEKSVRSSLRRLGGDALDVVQIHNAEAADVELPELWQVMDDLRERGLVRHWGASTYGERNALAVLAHPERFRILQVAVSLLDRSLEERVLPRAHATGTGVVLRSVFLKGVLSDRAALLPDGLRELARAGSRARRCAESLGVSLPALALRFAAFHPLAHVALAGTAQIDEIEQNAWAVGEGPLSSDALDAVRALRLEDTRLLDPATWEL